MENLKIELYNLLNGKTFSTIIDVDKIIDYYSFISSDFDSTDDLIELNFINKKIEEFIIGVGFKQGTKELFIITQKRKLFVDCLKTEYINYEIYKIEEFDKHILINLINKLKEYILIFSV